MRKRRLMAAAMAAVMLAGTLAGCSAKSGSDGTEAAKEESGTGQAAAEETLEGSLVSKEPKEFTVFLNFNNMPFDSSWQVWQEAAKRTNVSLKGTISLSNSNEEEAFNLMMGSGNLADIIGYVDASSLEKLGRDGGMIPLNDLIKEHAPNIQKVLDEDARFRQTAYSLDGNIYQIPKNQELKAAEFWWIRQDWLDKLNLKAPTTVDELHDVLYAFRNEDPNGNGLKDEIPLFDRAGWKQPDEYLYLWDTSLEFYPRDGQMKYEPLEENFKTGVTNMIKWYQEGLIDPEIFTRGASSRDTLLGGDVGGCTHDWVSTANYNTTLQETIPGFQMVAIAPPADQNGVVKERVSRYPGVGWGISSQCKDPVTVIKFMDYFFTEEGSDLMNWGIEGDTFTRDADGSKHFTDKVLQSELTPIGYLRSIGAQYRIGMCQDGDYEYATMKEDGIEANKLYNGHDEWFDDSLPPYLDGKMALKYTSDDETEYKNIMASIKPYVDEKFQSWILGVNDFDSEYDSFIKELKARGIDRALEINQKAYETFLGEDR
ncbi:extracellular solute-binding protein [Hungatella hathewayi]|uniref:extracellular solute-binding protein n=1 Tax=Hungatella hathewayi TaxID=154046 RepID=UPI0006C48EF4|nr:extracellular solute-binding protein [Hungatella hathewayi]CUP36193.1 extracellular solute-binding protein [Hungatella hathewayi]